MDMMLMRLVMQYAEYSLAVPSASGAAVQTQQAAHGPAPPVADDPQKDVHVTPREQLPVDSVQEKIEYRDEEGNLLNEEQVKALSGKVSFSTRYETRTRIVDAAGNEIADGLMESEESFAGTLAVGENPETKMKAGEGDASKRPPRANADWDIRKEMNIEENAASPEPAADAGRETGKNEL